MKTFYLKYIFLFISTLAFSQKKTAQDSLQRIATIQYEIKNDSVHFSSKTPPLNQIAGAPKAYYKHFWEFGDGDFSKDKTPSKQYKNKGEYEVKYWATNIYDTGKPPTTRPKKIKINQDTETGKASASMNEDLELIRNREPVPNQEMVVVMRYKNYKDYTTNGTLHLFFNETKYKADNFKLIDTRLYNAEKIINNEDYVFSNKLNNEKTFYASTQNSISLLKTKHIDSTEKENLELTLTKAKTTYKTSSSIEFNNMKPNEERNIFYTFKTTPEMLKDTSAIISVRSIYIPDNNYKTHKIKDMEMEIVTSHDPNKMSSNSTFLNYRLVRFKRPKFKIRFQNNGEGPATTIKLETDVPEMFDKTTIKIEDTYPKVPICPKNEVQYSCIDTTFTKTQAIFTFKNIYLPGSEQKNVKDYDSTQGFVKYSLKFGDNFHKKKTKSRTAIIFDKNEPIITNYSTTRFLPGISIGVKAGYNFYNQLENSKAYFIGATVSPFKSYRWYWQIELLNSFHEYTANTTINQELISFGPAGEQFVRKTTTTNTFNNIDWVIPVLARYNINNYIGLGAGLQGTISISQKKESNILIQDFENTQPPQFMFNEEQSIENSSTAFTNFRTGLLFEATVGAARIGPSAGARYVLNFKENFNYLQLYAIWKF